jgi:hypothetical protein
MEHATHMQIDAMTALAVIVGALIWFWILIRRRRK